MTAGVPAPNSRSLVGDAPREASEPGLAAALLVLAPALFGPVLVPPVPRSLGPEVVAWAPVALPAIAALSLAAPSVRRGWFGRVVGSLGLLLAAVGWSAAHPHQPALGALVLLGAAALLASLWPARDGSIFRGLPPVAVASAVAAVLALLGWTAALVGPAGGAAIAGSALMTGVLARLAASSRRDRQAASIAILWPLAWVMLREGDVLARASVPLLAAGPLLLLGRALPDRAWKPLGRVVSDHLVTSPARMLFSSFLGLSVVGTLLLALPVSDHAGRGLALVDAMFTAVSAVCVTGLLTIEPTTLTPFGRLVVLLLVQLGGLGILTFATAAAEWAGARIGVRQEATAAQLLGSDARSDLRQALRRVLGITFAFEGLGALLISWRLLADGVGLAGIPRGAFLAVSAFCNAGMTPWDGNLVPFARDPLLLAIVLVLEVAGSLGPALLFAIPELARGRKVPMYVRLVLLANAFLLAIPFGAFCFLEWTASFGHLPGHDRVMAALLLAASARSGGLVSVDLAHLEPATATLLTVLMFVGGNTGSTGGGIRVSTAAVLLLAAWSAIRGKRSAEFGCRQIQHRAVYEAVAVAGAMAAVVFGGLLLLELTHHLPLDQALFEVTSAVTTAGLSLGGTSELDGLGKLVLVSCMFAGRVGPLTLLLLLVQQREREGGAAWPSEEVPVG